MLQFYRRNLLKLANYALAIYSRHVTAIDTRNPCPCMTIGSQYPTSASTTRTYTPTTASSSSANSASILKTSYSDCFSHRSYSEGSSSSYSHRTLNADPLYTADSPVQYKVSTYFANDGIYRDFNPQQLPTGSITHVLYAFAYIQLDGTVYLSDTYADIENHYPTDSWNDVGNNVYGCVKQLYILKKRNRMMKVLLSIGGWGRSEYFTTTASTQAGRDKFASSAVALLKDLGFDGLDIDWEYPANVVDASNFVLLLAALRSALDEYATQSASRHHFLISVASPAGPAQYSILRLSEMDEYLDMWHLMAYDYAGGWSTFTGHNANLYQSTSNPNATPFSTHTAVTDYIAAGVTASKIVIGIPLYGRSFEDTAGMGQTFAGVGSGSREDGVWEYKVLPKQGAKEHFDNIGHFSYDDSTRELISYSTVSDVVSTSSYIFDHGLGGVFFWESSSDKSGQGSLVVTAATHFQGDNLRLDTSLNQLSYPESQYANIVAGMPGE